MGDIQKSQRLQDTTTTTTLTFAAPGSGKYNCINAVTADSDEPSLLTIESPSGTVLWQSQIGQNTGFDKTWPKDEFIKGAENQAILIKLDAGTTVHISAGGFVTP